MTEWNANQYLKFEDQRTRPARDLLSAVGLRAARRVADLGCGPANSTELLADRFPDAQLIGVDNAPDMLAEARRRLPAATFEQADIGAWTAAEPCDLIFANAALQWVPDHDHLLPRLARQLAPGGVLAIQMPDNLGSPSHTSMRETAAAGPWAAKLAGAAGARTILPSVQHYYDLLTPQCHHIDIWHTIYQHPLENVAAIVEWVKGTGLRPFLAPLDAAEVPPFLADYQRRLAVAYPPQLDGKVLLGFSRLFIVAVRKAG